MISPLALIGAPPQHRAHRDEPGFAPDIDPTARIEAFTSVDAGMERPTVIGPRVWLMKSVHVGHDSIIGEGTEVAPMTSIAGFVTIGKNVTIGQGVTIKNRLTIGDGARLGMGAVVIRDVPAGATVVGNPAAQMLEGKGSRQKQAELDGTPHPEMHDASWEEYRDAVLSA